MLYIIGMLIYPLVLPVILLVVLVLLGACAQILIAITRWATRI